MQTTNIRNDAASKALTPSRSRGRLIRGRSAATPSETPSGAKALTVALIDENFRRASAIARQAELMGLPLHVYWSADAVAMIGKAELSHVGAMILSSTARRELAMLADPNVTRLLSSIQLIFLEDRPAASAATEASQTHLSFGSEEPAARIVDAAMRMVSGSSRRDT